MSRSFAISDIHGCSKTFRSLIENTIKLEKSDSLYLLGDYIDRGVDSKGVLDYILDLIAQKYDVTVLKGNHEEMLLKSLSDHQYIESWIFNGGDKTLKSFHVKSSLKLPSKYVDFIRSMGYYKLTDQFILVHAGIDFDRPDPFEDKESMLWLRYFDVDVVKAGGRAVVHGHTPASIEKIKDYISKVSEDKIISIDNGCVYKSNNNLGQLCALELNTLELFFHPNID